VRYPSRRACARHHARLWPPHAPAAFSCAPHWLLPMSPAHHRRPTTAATCPTCRHLCAPAAPPHATPPTTSPSLGSGFPTSWATSSLPGLLAWQLGACPRASHFFGDEFGASRLGHPSLWSGVD
jgi:hypothetical protein